MEFIKVEDLFQFVHKFRDTIDQVQNITKLFKIPPTRNVIIENQ